MSSEIAIVIVACIAALGSLAGAVFLFMGTRGQSNATAKTALDARIDARVATQLSTAWDQIDALTHQNGQQALSIATHDRLEKALYTYVAQLRQHIVAGNPPPPPTMPLELIDWHEGFGDTEPSPPTS